MISVLLPAAGSGERIGRGPKAFLKVGNKTLLEWAIEAFSWADEVIVALPQGRLQGCPVQAVVGGATRQESVLNLLKAARGDTVLVHDVARPFVVREAVERLLEAAQKTGAATLSLAVPDTLVAESNGYYGTAIPREHYRLIQTPQGFDRGLLLEGHLAATQASQTYTDDAQVVLAQGHSVALVEGDRRMFKITYPEDLDLAEGIARLWKY